MNRTPILVLVGLVLLLPLLAPQAAAAPSRFVINVVSAEDLGCSPDLSGADLRVRVYVQGALVLETVKAQDQDEPLFGAVAPVDAELPALIEVEVDEAEPAGFFGTTWVSCAVAAGNASRASFFYQGQPFVGHTTRGDSERAAEVLLTIGTSPPPAPVVTATPGNTSVLLTWPADPTGTATGHRVAFGTGGAVIQASQSPTQATVEGLCDATRYTYRVVRDASSWHVSSADVTFTTTNAAPQAPSVLSATRTGNVTFDSPTLHDIDHWEVHAGPASGFSPGSATLRQNVPMPFMAMMRRQATTGVAFQAADEAVLVRAVDKGGLHADSARFVLDAAARTDFTGFATCGGGTASVGSTGTQSPSSTPSTTPTTTVPTSPTATTPTGPTPTGSDPSPPPTTPVMTAPPSPPPTPCCWDVDVSVDVPGVDGHWPRIVAGSTVNVTLRNEGTLAATVSLMVRDRFGDVMFDAGPSDIRLAPGESRRVALDVRTYSTANEAREVNGEIFALNMEIQDGAPVGWSTNVLIDVPADLVSEQLFGGAIDVKRDGASAFLGRGDGFALNASPGQVVAVEVTVVNRADHPIVIESFDAPALRNDSDIGRIVIAWGFQTEWQPGTLTLAPFSKRNVTITFRVPENATVGETVGAQVRLKANNSVRVEETPIFFNVQVAPSSSSAAVAVSTGASAGGVKLGLVAAGSVVAVGAGGALLWLRRDAARFALAAAMYTRLAKSEMLHHPGREALLARIKAQPGVCYSDLKAATEMNTGAIVHHLRALERSGYVTSRKEGAFRRFYPAGAAPTVVHAVVQTLPSLTPAQERVMELLREAPMTQGEVAMRLKLSQQVVSHHVRTLERAGHLTAEFDGRVWRYKPVIETAVEP